MSFFETKNREDTHLYSHIWLRLHSVTKGRAEIMFRTKLLKGASNLRKLFLLNRGSKAIVLT